MSQLIHYQPLRRRCHSARSYNTQHKLISRFQLGTFAFAAQVPVILHVAAMEFQQTVVVLRQSACNRIAQRRFQCTAQVVALQLDMFNIAWRSADRLHR
ncbi:hypothetical protein D3C81_1724580 [compost metagenome]